MEVMSEETLRRDRLANQAKPVLVVAKLVGRELYSLLLADQSLQLHGMHYVDVLKWIVLALHVELLVLHLEMELYYSFVYHFFNFLFTKAFLFRLAFETIFKVDRDSCIVV